MRQYSNGMRNESNGRGEKSRKHKKKIYDKVVGSNLRNKVHLIMFDISFFHCLFEISIFWCKVCTTFHGTKKSWAIPFFPLAPSYSAFVMKQSTFYLQCCLLWRIPNAFVASEFNIQKINELIAMVSSFLSIQ